MRTSMRAGALAMAIVGMLPKASAILITAGTTPSLKEGNETSTSVIVAFIQASPYSVGPELYKKDVNSEDGDFKNSYNTSFGSGSLLDENFTITYGGSGPVINYNHKYLLVKDGNATPVWYLYDISAWNGTDVLQGENFWNGPGGSISHVSIYGYNGDVPREDVPDGGSTMALFGLGLVGVDYLRRRILKP
jgi:hypothetical protein